MLQENSIKVTSRTAKYTISQNKEGQFAIECHAAQLKNETLIPMISRRNPIKEAERLIGNFILKEDFLAIVFGAASIYLIKKLLQQQTEKGGNILLIEVDITLLEELIRIKLIPSDKIFIVSLANQHLLVSLIENIKIETLLGYRIFKNTISIQLNQDFYVQIENEIKKQLASRFSDLFTRLEFEPKWIINSLSQVSLFNNSYPVKMLFQKGINMKAILVSSGPSLRHCLPFLKKNAHIFFIACVDSIYRVLHNYGIKPHLIITLDAQAFTVRHFLGLSQGTINDYPILYADLVANPQVTRIWKGHLFFGITAQYMGNMRKVTLGSDYIEDTMRAKNVNFTGFGDIQSGGSVATSLFDLLRQMNFDEIIFVGQDLAYTNREIHCTGTHHTTDWIANNVQRFDSMENINHKVVKKRSTNYQRSIQGKPIIADYILSLYRQWFEDAGRRKLEVKVFNGTYEGLPIKNIPNISLEDIKIPNIHPPKMLFHWFEHKKKIANNSMIKEFRENILNEVFSEQTSQQYPFMKSIGRKNEIQAQRKILNQHAINYKSDEAIKKEKLKYEKTFWEKLHKRLNSAQHS